MTDTNEQTLPNNPPKRKPRKEKPFFTMENWDDERVARKHIRGSMDEIRSRLKDEEGIKTQFKKKRHEDGTQSYAIFYGRPEAEGKRVVYSDHDYLAVHFDPARKLPGGRRPKKKAQK